MLEGKKTHSAAAVQAILGLVGIACFLKPDLVAVASALGMTILTPDQALFSLVFGLSQVISGLKSMASRLALSKLKG